MNAPGPMSTLKTKGVDVSTDFGLIEKNYLKMTITKSSELSSRTIFHLTTATELLRKISDRCWEDNDLIPTDTVEEEVLNRIKGLLKTSTEQLSEIESANDAAVHITNNSTDSVRVLASVGKS